MQIIVFGRQGVGKSTLVGSVLAKEHGLEHVREWDGVSRLPERCVAETNVEDFYIPQDAVVLTMRRT